MQKKVLKAILIMLVVLVLVLLALPYVCELLGLRIWLIRVTVKYDLPFWLQMWLWGW